MTQSLHDPRIARQSADQTFREMLALRKRKKVLVFGALILTAVALSLLTGLMYTDAPADVPPSRIGTESFTD